MLVGFQVGWALAALQLSISAERVVNLSVVLVFATLTCNLARNTNHAPNKRALFKKQKAPLDRRWPAVLFEDGIEFRQNNCDNVYGEAIYSAAVWGALSGAVVKSRQIPELRRVKAAYCIGESPALNSVEADLSNAAQDQLHRTDQCGDVVATTTTPATRDDFFRSVENAHCDIRGLTFPTTPEAYLKFVRICDRLALKASLPNSDDPYFEFYTADQAIRCQLAVDIAMPAKYFSREPKLINALANNLSDLSICEGLRYLDLRSLSIDTNEKLQRPILCFIDFADQKNTFVYQQFREAQKVGARPVDLLDREPEVTTNAEPAARAAEDAAAVVEAPPARASTTKPRQSLIHSSDPIYGHLPQAPNPQPRSPFCLHPPSDVSASAESASSDDSQDAQPLPLLPTPEKIKKKSAQKKALKKSPARIN